ncbi:spore germination protein [Gracilibacillus xinjiangensis]|uniref:Spore germination protein n=1 Tax=Gracilibacillus xinjiangensis TaxID=1193282 RepID=A0ABV8WZE7_9BACI
MTIILGPVTINSNEGIIVSNTLNTCPTFISKTVAGAGSFNTGYWIKTNTNINRSSSIDPDINDANIAENI